MHAVRRAALRAASSSTPSMTAASVSRQQRASLAMLFTQATARPAAMPMARFFSQTSRRANEEREIVEEATKAAQEGGSTNSLGALEEAAKPRRSVQDDGHTIFVSNMSFDATDMHLREAFGKYGDITSVNIGRDGRGLSRGFGFVTFTTQAAAQRALEECDKSFWHGRRINVQHRQPREQARPARTTSVSPSEPTTSLYVGNIPYETSDADLNRLFRELENITDVRVAVDRNTGWPRGFAHADFANVESAIKAHEAIGQMTLGGRNLRVDYSQRRSNFSPRNREQQE